MNLFKLFNVNLRWFGENAGEVTGAVGEIQTEDNGDIETQESMGGDLHRKKERVVYGKQKETDNQPEEKEEAAVSLDERFDELVRGEFKDVYNKRVSNHIKKRLGDVKSLEGQNKKMQAVMDVLSDKYGVCGADEILEKLQNDNAIFEQAAEDAGLTVEQYKKMKALQRDSVRLREMEKRYEREKRAHEIYNKWIEDGKAVAEVYPKFNLAKEMENPDFRSLIQNNIPMKKAYETIHFDELVKDVSEFSARRAEENTVNNIRNRQSRPNESIGQGSSGVVIKDDPSKLSSKDIGEIIKRTQAGEIISF